MIWIPRRAARWSSIACTSALARGEQPGDTRTLTNEAGMSMKRKGLLETCRLSEGFLKRGSDARWPLKPGDVPTDAGWRGTPHSNEKQTREVI